MEQQSMMGRPGIQELVKSAMEGTLNRAQLFAEAARQQGAPIEDVEEKVASAPERVTPPPEVCEKYASALDWLAESFLKQAADPGSAGNASPGVGPGQGANALAVTSVNPKEENVDANETGQAKVTPPLQPPFESPPGTPPSLSNALATNLTAMPQAQPEDPLGNATASNAPQKQASALAAKNIEFLSKQAFIPGAIYGGLTAPTGEGVDGALRGAAGNMLGGALGALGGSALGALAGPAGATAGGVLGGLGGGVYGTLKATEEGRARAQLEKQQRLQALQAAPKEAADLAASNLLRLKKLAEDAINPAHITAGAAKAQGSDPPEGASAAGEGPVPPVPAPTKAQANLIGSNEAAIDYTKREAKANMRSDMDGLLKEPMQSASGDSMLQKTLDHTAPAGAKIASQQLVKTAAAHALLLKLAQAQEAEKKAKSAKKEKNSNMGGGLSTPQGQSGFNAASMM